jgi:hypothetical protein
MKQHVLQWLLCILLQPQSLPLIIPVGLRRRIVPRLIVGAMIIVSATNHAPMYKLK